MILPDLCLFFDKILSYVFCKCYILPNKEHYGYRSKCSIIYISLNNKYNLLKSMQGKLPCIDFLKKNLKNCEF